jgi:hypothetical protein
MSFDYNRPAALFLKSPTGRGPPLGYRRFWSAAEGIRFAVEDLPVTGMQVWLEVGNSAALRECRLSFAPPRPMIRLAAQKKSPAS